MRPFVRSIKTGKLFFQIIHQTAIQTSEEDIIQILISDHYYFETKITI